MLTSPASDEARSPARPSGATRQSGSPAGRARGVHGEPSRRPPEPRPADPRRALGLHLRHLHSIRNFLEHDMPAYAAALSYRALFALFAFLAFPLVLLGSLQVSSLFEWLVGQARAALQAQYAGLGEQMIRQVLYQAQGGLSCPWPSSLFGPFERSLVVDQGPKRHPRSHRIPPGNGPCSRSSMLWALRS